MLSPDGDPTVVGSVDLGAPQVRDGTAVRHIRFAALPEDIDAVDMASGSNVAVGLWIDGAFAVKLAFIPAGVKYQCTVAFTSVASDSGERAEYEASLDEDVVDLYLQGPPVVGKPRVIVESLYTGQAAVDMKEFESSSLSRDANAQPAQLGQLSRGGVLLSKRYDPGMIPRTGASRPLQAMGLRMLPSRQLAYVAVPHATEDNAAAKGAHHPVVLLSPGALRG